MSRDVFATGRTEMPNPVDEIARLREELVTAKKNQQERPSSFYELRLKYAEMAIEEFEARHPELVNG